MNQTALRETTRQLKLAADDLSAYFTQDGSSCWETQCTTCEKRLGRSVSRLMRLTRKLELAIYGRPKKKVKRGAMKERHP